MNFWKLEVSHSDDPRIWDLLDTHGMAGYGFYIWIMNLIYRSEDSGFVIELSDRWIRKTARDAYFSDKHTVVRYLDTLSELGLINRQLYQEKIISSDGVLERADAYMKRKIKEREKKRNQRKKAATLQNSLVSPGDSEGTRRDIANVPPPDPDPDPDPDTDPEKIVDPVNTACPQTDTSESVFDEGLPANQASLKKGTTEQVLSKIPESMRNRFNTFWPRYCRFCEDRGKRAGSKKDAAIAWCDLVKTNFRGKGIEAFNEGARIFANGQGKSDDGGIPNACRFLYSTRRGSGYWEDALEQHEASKKAKSKLGQNSSTPKTGVHRVVTGSDYRDIPEDDKPTPEQIARLKQSIQRIS